MTKQGVKGIVLTPNRYDLRHFPGSIQRILFTARIRGKGESTVFSLFVSSHLGGVPQSGLEGTPPQVWVGGVPSPRSKGGYPISGLGWGGYPIQVLIVGGTPGNPQLGLDGGGGTWGTPHHQDLAGWCMPPGMVYHPWTWDGVPPEMGHPPPSRPQDLAGWCTSLPRNGVPPWT